MWKSLFVGMVRLSLQTFCNLEGREYIENGFCRVQGMNWKGTYPSSWTQGVIDVEEADCIFHRTGLEGRVDASCLGHNCGLLFVCDRR
jgi:hypothetical protein